MDKGMAKGWIDFNVVGPQSRAERAVKFYTWSWRSAQVAAIVCSGLAALATGLVTDAAPGWKAVSLAMSFASGVASTLLASMKLREMADVRERAVVFYKNLARHAYVDVESPQDVSDEAWRRHQLQICEALNTLDNDQRALTDAVNGASPQKERARA